jgi:hypothetical protein
MDDGVVAEAEKFQSQRRLILSLRRMHMSGCFRLRLLGGGRSCDTTFVHEYLDFVWNMHASVLRIPSVYAVSRCPIEHSRPSSWFVGISREVARKVEPWTTSRLVG